MRIGRPMYRFHQWQANLRILDVEAIKRVPYEPLSHPFVERLIVKGVLIRSRFLSERGEADDSRA